MEKIKNFWNCLDITMKITIPLYIAIILHLPFIVLDDNAIIKKISITIYLVALAVIYPIVKKKPDSFTIHEKRILYKSKKIDMALFIAYIIDLGMSMASLQLSFKPEWIVKFICIFISLLSSWVISHYFTLIYHISKEFKSDNKGE